MLDARLVNHCLCVMAGICPTVLAGKRSIDAIFIWGRAANEWQTRGENAGVVQLAAELRLNLKTKEKPYIVIPDYVGSERGQGEFGYPGPTVWAEELQCLGVSKGAIQATPGNGINTKTEFDDFLYVLQCRATWRSIAVVTLQTHALRAMLGVVESLTQFNMLDSNVFPVWPTMSMSRLTDLVYGSQGTGPHRKIDWIDQEFDRIPQYMAQGDLATLERLRTYLHGLVE